MSRPLSSPPIRRPGRRALVVVGLYAAAVTLLVLLSLRGMDVLSALRAFVNGEGLWTRAQKEAVIALHHLADSRDPTHLEAYRQAIAVTAGDRLARLELEKPDPDLSLAREGLLRGRNHPDDIDGMIRLFRGYRENPYVDRAIRIWAEADVEIVRLDSLATSLRDAVAAAGPDSVHTPVGTAVLDAIQATDARLSLLEEAFSDAMGEGARWLQRRLAVLLSLTAALLVAGVGVGSWLLLRRTSRTEARLALSERRYRELFERNVAGTLRAAPDGTLLECNEAMARILGFRHAAELRGRNITEFYPDPADRDALLAALRERGTLANYEVRLRRRDGRELWLLANTSLLEDPVTGRPVISGTVADITDRREAEAGREEVEEQLRQSQKMGAVGQLAAGVAHDFNNLLTAILGHASLLEDHLDAASPAGEDLREIRTAALQAAELVRQLLTFSRADRVEPTRLDVEEVVTDLERMLRRMIGEDVDLVTRIAPDLHPVWMDRSHLEQVLVNLAVNARDAMPEGGRLTLSAANVTVSPGRAPHPDLPPGEWVRIEVSDTGVGMDQAVRRRVFEPFFTTREAGRGTGLGLSTTYATVRRAEGRIYVSSRPSQGSRFEVFLPRAPEEKPAPRAAPTVAAADGEPGGATVLLVEDAPPVRELARRVLAGRGYRVLAAADGEEALGLLKEAHGPPIDLLLTDVVMPGMSGGEVAERVRRLRPGVRVLFMSGYAEETALGRVGAEGAPLLPKPFSPEELLRRVREVLQGAGDGGDG